ncbi:MAG TPA: hypothetical protein VFZ97_11790 [Acidimicrobiales bacterium]
MTRRHRVGLALAAIAIALAASAGAAMAATPSSPPGSAGTRAAAPEVRASDVTPPSVPASFAGDVQAVAIRIEADEPLPAGSGDIPSMSGEVNSDEGISKAQAAVDLLGAVTGPKLADPTGDGHQYAQDPQAACNFPPASTAAQSYPLQGSDQQTAQSEVTCREGPSATALAYSAQIGGNAGVTNSNELQTLGVSALPLGINGATEGHASLAPDATTGTARMSADAEATSFSIPGMLQVSHVSATGWTAVGGRPGSASTHADVSVSDLEIGGAAISLGSKGVSLGSSPPVPVDSAQPLVASFNQVASSVGCELTVLSSPSTYPQGPLFARPPLPNRVNPDGTDAGSTAAGLVIRCVVPESINTTNFKPLILQILFGFVGTEAHASTQAPQFGIGPGNDNGPSTGQSTYSAGLAAPISASPSGVAVPASPSLSNPPAPAVTARLTPTTVAPRATVVTGALIGLRSGLELGGLAVGGLLIIAALALVSPWRVSLAPPGHPEL